VAHTQTQGADRYGLTLLGTDIVLFNWPCCRGSFGLPLLSILDILFRVVAIDDGVIIARSSPFEFRIL
jgi:hypothetical protein